MDVRNSLGGISNGVKSARPETVYALESSRKGGSGDHEGRPYAIRKDSSIDVARERSSAKPVVAGLSLREAKLTRLCHNPFFVILSEAKNLIYRRYIF